MRDYLPVVPEATHLKYGTYEAYLSISFISGPSCGQVYLEEVRLYDHCPIYSRSLPVCPMFRQNSLTRLGGVKSPYFWFNCPRYSSCSLLSLPFSPSGKFLSLCSVFSENAESGFCYMFLITFRRCGGGALPLPTACSTV